MSNERRGAVRPDGRAGSGTQPSAPWRSVRSLGLAAAVVSFVVACGDPATAPSGRALPVGEFVLVWVDGFPLPYESPACASFPQDCQSTIERGLVTINEDGSFRITLTWQHQWPTISTEGAVDVNGDVRVVGNSLSFSWRNPAENEPAVVMTAVFERDGFSIVRLPLADTCCDPFQWTPESQINTARLRFGQIR